MGANPSLYKNNPATGEEQAKRPVERVTWFACIAFCNELTKKCMSKDECIYYNSSNTPYTIADAKANKSVKILDWNKKGFRLPTEAEWEYAARAGQHDPESPSVYSGTNISNELNKYAWYMPVSHSPSDIYISHEVAKKQPNAYGLYDMSGNVDEWCYDWDIEFENNKDYGNDYSGPENGITRILRGGNFKMTMNTCLVWNRQSLAPNMYGQEVGFRIVYRP